MGVIGTPDCCTGSSDVARGLPPQISPQWQFLVEGIPVKGAAATAVSQYKATRQGRAAYGGRPGLAGRQWLALTHLDSWRWPQAPLSAQALDGYGTGEAFPAIMRISKFHQ